jgi:hypothetical protein
MAKGENKNIRQRGMSHLPWSGREGKVFLPLVRRSKKNIPFHAIFLKTCLSIKNGNPLTDKQYEMYLCNEESLDHMPVDGHDRLLLRQCGRRKCESVRSQDLGM